MLTPPADDLPLRDIHPAVAPPWWPPAPGWWWLAAASVTLALALGLWRWHRRRRRRALIEMFDAALRQAGSPAAQLAAMSELLRRAARRHAGDAAALDGEAWLRLLDQDMPRPEFSTGAGRLLLVGPYRPEVAAAEVEALRPLARARFLRWMEAG